MGNYGRMQELDILILGAGWTSTFLIPLMRARHMNFAATTRDGRVVAGMPTMKWNFDPDEDEDTEGDKNQFSGLPLARTVLITFPLTGKSQSKLLVKGYTKGAKAAPKSEEEGPDHQFIQLGSTGIWQIEQKSDWVSRKSPYNKENSRAIAEDELLKLGGCVLNLAGLWGGERDPKNWVDRVATTKQQVKDKKSLHMVHGVDVARAILAVAKNWEAGQGERWMLTDGFVYDWWSLFAGWANVKAGEKEDRDDQPSEQSRWVYELMREEDVCALPRSMKTLGRCYDSREFWETFAVTPLKARI